MKRPLGWFPVAVVFVAFFSSGALAQGIGEVVIYGGLAKGSDSARLPTSFMAGGSLAFIRGSFSLGPEFHYSTGGGRKLVGWGGVARLTLGSGSVRPYLVGGLGSYNWKQANAVTVTAWSGSLGAGIVLGDPRGHGGFLGEVRVHDHLQNIGVPASLRLISATAGVRLHWR